MNAFLARQSTPTRILFPYVFLTNLVSTFYAAFQISPPVLLELLIPLVFLWLIAWWLVEDSRRTHVTWPVDTGMFLYGAWIVLLPYHLFKTRGLRAFIGIFAMIGTMFAAWLVAAIVIVKFGQ
jgi:hypothetical protein